MAAVIRSGLNRLCRTTLALVRLRIDSARAGSDMKSTGTAIAPRMMIPQYATAHQEELGPQMSTLSPGITPPCARMFAIFRART